MTGAGRYVVELARHLPSLDARLDLIVSLLPMMRETGVPAQLADQGARVEYVAVPVASWRQWLVIPRALRRLQPAVYHYPFLDLPLTPVPSVTTIYDLNPILDREYFGGPGGAVKRAIARRIIGSTVRR